MLFFSLQSVCVCVLSRVSIDGSRWYQQAALAAGGVYMCVRVHVTGLVSIHTLPAPLIVKWITPCVQTEKGGKKSGRTQNGIRRLLIGPDSFIVNSFQFINPNPC